MTSDHHFKYLSILIQATLFRLTSGNSLQLPKLVPMELIVEASPRRVYANAHTYVSLDGVELTSETIL
jgi:hypothetical protein